MAGNPWDEKWKIDDDKFGKGGQGTTMLVSSVADPNIKGVLKKLKNNRDEHARSRMYREVVNLQTLSATGVAVPKVFDHNTDRFADSAQLYAATEYIPGPTLEAFLQEKGPMQLEEACRLVHGLAATMKRAHEFPIIHRDLKPANIVLRDSDPAQPVTIDYGLAFNTSESGVTDTAETFRNEFLDLPEFRTPGANKRDPRSDVTTLSAILHYCICRVIPGPLLDAAGMPPHKRIGSELVKFLPNDGQTRSLDTFLSRGFNQSVELRFASVGEFVERLNHCITSASRTHRPNPAQAAKTEGARLHQIDRKTQLHSYSEKLNTDMSQVQQKFGQTAGKISPYNCGQTGIPQQVPILPAGFDELGAFFRGQVGVNNHDQLGRVVVFSFAARGDQCALLRCIFRRSKVVTQKTGRLVIEKIADWETLFWFEGGTEPDKTLIEFEVDRFMEDSIRELTDEIAEAGTT